MTRIPEIGSEATEKKVQGNYGSELGDDCYNLPVERKKSEIRYSRDDGVISSNSENRSTVCRQVTGDSRPIEDRYELE